MTLAAFIAKHGLSDEESLVWPRADPLSLPKGDWKIYNNAVRDLWLAVEKTTGDIELKRTGRQTKVLSDIRKDDYPALDSF